MLCGQLAARFSGVGLSAIQGDIEGNIGCMTNNCPGGCNSYCGIILRSYNIKSRVWQRGVCRRVIRYILKRRVKKGSQGIFTF